MAFQTLGDGPLDVLLGASFLGSVQVLWEHPAVTASLRRLAGCGRLVVFDRLGVGASDPDDPSADVGASWAMSATAVLDHLRSEHVVGVAWNQSAMPFLSVACARPERFERVILVNGALLGMGAFRGGSDDATVEEGLWGDGREFLEAFAPSTSGDPTWREWFDRAGHLGASPRTAERFWRWLMEFDRVPLPEQLPCPVDVVQAGREPSHAAPAVREAVAVLQSATLELSSPPVLVDSADLLAFTPDMPRYVEAIERLVRPDVRAANPVRRLMTVCFTDLVGSTERAAGVGDATWRGLLDRHDRLVATHVGRHGGRVVKSTGDGHLSVFDSPTGAVECLADLLADLQASQLVSRAGVHTGEVEVREDDVGGLAVHVAARVCSAAGAGEIWVSDTVRTATLGGPISYEAVGAHQLKGIEGQWSLHRVLAVT